MIKFVLCSAAALSFTFSAAALAEEAAKPAPVTAAAPATDVAVKRGQMLRDSTGRRIGRIEVIRQDAASVIFDGKIYYIPLNTISVTSAGAATSLSAADIRKL